MLAFDRISYKNLILTLHLNPILSPQEGINIINKTKKNYNNNIFKTVMLEVEFGQENLLKKTLQLYHIPWAPIFIC